MGAAGPFHNCSSAALKSQLIGIAGFVPLFFDNATIGVYANNKVVSAQFLSCLSSWTSQVFGSALIAGWVGMAAYGGYLACGTGQLSGQS